MGFLGAFLRGAGGQGVLEVSRRADQRESEDRAYKRRDAERDEERAYRTAEAEKNRELQTELLRERLAAGQGGAGGSRRRGGAGGGGADDDDAEQMVVGGLMKARGVDAAQAGALLAASREGRNVFETKGTATDMVDEGDGRMRAVTRPDVQPDPVKWAELNRQIGELVMRAPAYGRSNLDQVAQGEGEFKRQGYVDRYVDTGSQRAAEGSLLLAKKDLANADGSSVVTGKAGPGTLAQAKIGTEGARATAERAQAGKYGEEAKSEKDKREGRGSIKDDLGRIDSERKSIATQLADVRAREAAALKDLDATPADKSALAARRQMLERQADTLNERFAKLDAKLDARDAPATKGATGGKPKPPPASTMQAAKAAIAKGAKREDVVKRLRDAGFDTSGL